MYNDQSFLMRVIAHTAWSALRAALDFHSKRHANSVMSTLALASFVLLTTHRSASPADGGESDWRARLANSALASPFRIPREQRQRTIRYRLSLSEGFALQLPSSGEQRVVPALQARPSHISVIEICSECGDEAAPSAQTLAELLQPHDLVDSDHVRVRQLARAWLGKASVGVASNPEQQQLRVERAMRQLAKELQRHMNGSIRYAGHRTASEALQERGGDCGEFAVALAALGRAVGVPTRLAIGHAYASSFLGRKQVFAPHIWVQAWTGQRWQSVDPALQYFSSTHLLLATSEGSLNPAAIASFRNLRIVSAGLMPRQTPSK